jgi:ATP-dependent RNA helicase DDX47/RRP3
MDSVTVGSKKRKKSSKRKSEKRQAVRQEVGDEAQDTHPPALQQSPPKEEQPPKRKKKKSKTLAQPAADEDKPGAASSARADAAAGVDAIAASIQGTGPKVEKPVSKEPRISDGVVEEPEEKPKSFKELGVCEELCTAVAQMGWKAATAIQSEALPYALQDRDIIGLAETGSGKTGAFGIPILQRLLLRPQPLYALVIAPTRELAFQIGEQLEAIGSQIDVKCTVIVGGVDMVQQQIALARRPHIIVSTPGRIVDHLQNTKGFHLRNLKALVLDEADKLLNMDFEKEINLILSVIPRERTTYLFSATMTSKVAKLQRASLSNPVKLEVSSKYGVVKTLLQSYLFMPMIYKDVYLTYVMNELAGNSIICFAATCATCTRLSLMLRSLGFGAVPLHGQMSQPKRLGALARFKSNSRQILIATDVASRGLDIPAVDAVLNYDLPASSKDYIHRVGRTARAGRSGKAINLVTQYDVEVYQRIEKMQGQKLARFPAEEADVMLLQERVAEASRFAQIEMRELDQKKKDRGGDGRDRGEDGEDEEGSGQSYGRKHGQKKGGNRGGGRRGR